ncbi:MAG: MFS transporter [Promethearchaeota archaeon]|nr:MAG: MFS transporter [Candidatus Lokiarchaeota archaeon]
MSENNISERERVHSRRGYLLYSLGGITSALPYNMVGTFFVFFYAVKLGLSLELVGLVFLLYGLWNAINDPLFGYYMDKKITKWGRRVPYIVLGTIPLAIGFILLWYVPWSSEILIFFHALFMLFLFDTGFTLAMTAWAALYTEMYEEEKERATVVAIKDSIAFTSSLIGIIFPPLIAAAVGWSLTGLILGIIISITMYLSLLGTKERKEYHIDKPLPLIPAFKETFKNKSFVIMALTYTLIDTCFAITLIGLPLYAKFILKLDEALLGFAAVGVALGALISIPFWRLIYSRKGAKYGLLLAIGIFAIGIWPVFLINDFIALIIITLIPGFGIGGVLMTELPFSAAIDYDELRTGKRREATYNGILTLIARLAIAFSGLALIIVQLYFGFEAGSESQSSSALLGLTLLVSLIPFVVGIIAFIVFSFFPINQKYFREMQSELKILHEKRLEELKKS